MQTESVTTDLHPRTPHSVADPVRQLTTTETIVAAVHRDIAEGIRAAGAHMTTEQGLLLARLGTERMTVGELCSRGAYLGNNATYNVRKLVDHGYLAQERSAHDRRQTYIWCTPRGLEIAGRIRAAVSQSHHLTRVRIIP